jgi:IS5 family transposase
MKKAVAATGEVGAQFRDRSRSVKRRILEIAYAARNKSEKGQEKMKAAYRKLLEATSRVVGQAKRFSGAVAGKAKQQLDEMIPRVQQVIQQARARVLGGNTRADHKILSMFEPDTEVIRKGKASKPTEFGKMVKIQEAENQIVIHCEVFDQRPSDSDLLTPSIEKHKELLGRVPDLAAADAGFFSGANEAAAKQLV